MQLPSPSEVNPLAHVTSEFLFGRQFPYPSEKYPLGHGLLTDGVSLSTIRVTGSQPPFPSLSYPETQTFGISIVAQTPSPSNL
jgi:hypothetical protein